MQIKDAVVNIGVRQDEIQKFIFELDEKLKIALDKLSEANLDTAPQVLDDVHAILDSIYQQI